MGTKSFMRKVFRSARFMACFIGILFSPLTAYAGNGHKMHRLYNPNSGEHFYTYNFAERDNAVFQGWQYEGIAWTAPESGDAVYRLYNPNSGDHHYTMNSGERDSLVQAGWKDENIGWYSDTSQGEPLYRLYNPNAKSGSHHYTTSAGEAAGLASSGWKDENIGWYGLAGGSQTPSGFVRYDDCTAIKCVGSYTNYGSTRIIYLLYNTSNKPRYYEMTFVAYDPMKNVISSYEETAVIGAGKTYPLHGYFESDNVSNVDYSIASDELSSWFKDCSTEVSVSAQINVNSDKLVVTGTNLSKREASRSTQVYAVFYKDGVLVDSEYRYLELSKIDQTDVETISTYNKTFDNYELYYYSYE